MAHTHMPRLQSAFFHSDLLRIFILSASLAHPKEGHWCHLREVSCWLLQWWIFFKRVYTLPTRQQGSGRGHLCPQLRLWCWGAVQHSWQLEAFQNSFWFTSFDSLNEAADLEGILTCMLSMCFLSHPGNVDVQLTRLCWMARAWIAWNVVWNVPLWGPRFAQPRRFQGLPVWTMRAEPTIASQQTDAMPHMSLDWFVICHVGVVLFLFEGRGVWNIRILPPWDCRVWGTLRWMWMLWHLRMATASTAQPTQPAQSVLQATRRSCVRAARQTSFLRASAASNAPKHLISVQARPSLRLSLHWSLHLVQSFGYGCGGQFKPNNLQAL